MSLIAGKSSSVGKKANDSELLQTMTRVVATADAVVIEVADIHWLQPHSPFTVWHPLEVLSPDTPSERIEAYRARLLERKKFFAICDTCGLRHAKGHMHAASLCMSCAQENHSVVY